MKSYTDIKQSAQLAILLPKESADMWWTWFSNPLDDVNGGEYDKEPLLHEPVCSPDKAIPCWSLTALLNYLRKIDFFPEIDADEHSVTMSIFYIDVEENKSVGPLYNIKVKAENFIDACYDLILKLKEKDLL